jgi:hypothetical protein
MTDFLDRAAQTLRALGGSPWQGIAISIGLWTVLSFVAAVCLGRMIRRADRKAGISDDPLFYAQRRELLDDPELDFPYIPAGRARERREPTRSGPFAIERGAATSYRSRVAGDRRR